MTSPDERPTSVRPVEYKGEPLDSERGPGLGCFRIQLVVLVVMIILTPLSVAWQWPPVVSAVLLFAVILLLLFAGQTVIFLLRLVAADRREGRRRPLAGQSKTVGELEDEARAGTPQGTGSTHGGAPPAEPPIENRDPGSSPAPGVRE